MSSSSKPTFTWYMLGDMFWQFGKRQSTSWGDSETNQNSCDTHYSFAAKRDKSIEVLAALPLVARQAVLADSLGGGDGSPPALAGIVRSQKSDEGRQHYALPAWHSDLKLKVCRVSKLTEFLLSGTTLVVPWPGGRCLDLDDTKLSLPVHSILADDLYLDAIMSIGDALVTGKLRDEFDDKHKDPPALKRTFQREINEHFAYAGNLPAGFQIKSLPKEATDKSRLEWDGENWTLLLGVLEQAKNAFQPWPCGGF